MTASAPADTGGQRPAAAAGYSGRVLCVDLTSGSARVDRPTDDDWRRYAGTALMGVRYLLERTPAGLDPFDPGALLMFWSSAVAGHRYVGLARCAVVAKSPLTGGIGESRVAGPFAPALKASGYDGLVISGAAAAPTYLLLEQGRLTLRDASGLWGCDTARVTDILKRRHGDHAAVAAIGVAGERLVRYASVVTEGAFAAARMGLGAVMGAKQLKALVVVGGQAPPVHDAAALQALTRRYAEAVPGNSLTRSQHDDAGFVTWFLDGDVTGYAGATNFATSALPDWGATRGEMLGMVQVGHGLCPGCPSDCMKTFGEAPQAAPVVLDEEAAASFALYLGVTGARSLVQLARACQILGLDPVSTASTLAWLRESAARGAVTGEEWVTAPWHDPSFLLELVRRVAERQPGVHWLGEGVRRAAESAGGDAERYAMHVKGLEMSPLDPRASAGQALAYAVAPLGPRYEIVEHDIDFDPVDGYPHGLDQMRTLGTTEWEPMAQLDARRIARTAVLLEMWSGLDALGVCLYAGPPVRILTLRDVAALVSAVTGWETSDSEIFLWGRRRWQLMRLYNLREGIDAAADTLPQRFFREPIDAGRHVGHSLDEDTFRAAVAQYYELAGWDAAGVPRPGTLTASGLDWAAPRSTLATTP